MSAPTREEFDQLAAQYQELASNYRRLEAEIKQIREQPHVIVDHQLTGYEPLIALHEKLDRLAAQVETNTATFEQLMIGQSTQLKAISDQGESIRVLQADVTSIKKTMATKADIKEAMDTLKPIFTEILRRLPPSPNGTM